MTSRARPIPEGYDRATPYLCVGDAAGAIEFYRKAFGATELMRLTQPDGKIGHAEIKIGAAPMISSTATARAHWRTRSDTSG